jgi:hypothetical protein
MKIAEGATLFMGLKVDQKIREQLAACSEIDKRYFSGDPEYLTFTDGPGGEQFIGRTLGSEISTDQLDDMRRNIVSILKRIAPSVRPERALIILPCTGGPSAGTSTSAADASTDEPEPS